MNFFFSNIFYRFLGSNIRQRWIFAVMGCLAITNAYAMRICLSLAITEMVKPRAIISNETLSEELTQSYKSTFSGWSGGQTYQWDEYTQVSQITSQ